MRCKCLLLIYFIVNFSKYYTILNLAGHLWFQKCVRALKTRKLSTGQYICKHVLLGLYVPDYC